MATIKPSREVAAVIRDAEMIIPPSGDAEALLDCLSRHRGRPMRLLRVSLSDTLSGMLISTQQADYVAVSEGASPEREAAIICHEVAHALLGHEHDESLSESLVDSGLFSDIDPHLARSVVAARQAYTYSAEVDAELLATFISADLRRRVLRGGHSFYDDRWR